MPPHSKPTSLTASILMALPPTRFRGIGRPAATAIVILTLVAIAALVAIANGYQLPAAATSSTTGDMEIYARVVERMRHGQDYYTAAHADLRAAGYGTRSVFNWRLPMWPWLESLMPSRIWASVVLGVAAIAAGLAAAAFVFVTVDIATATLVALALAVSLFACATPAAALFTEVVAGVLILASVSAYGLNRPLWGFAAALLALFVRELAAPYIVICVYFAWRERRTTEIWAWAAGLAVFAGYFLWHAAMVHAQLGPDDIAYRDGWIQFGGPGFVLATAAFNGVFIAEPPWATAILLPLCVVGLIAWRGPGSCRVGVTVAAYFCLFAIVGKRFNDYWGGLYTPLMTMGIAFLPAAVRDLAGAARRPAPPR